MKKGTVRRVLKLSFLVNVLFFVAVYLDYTRNVSRWMLPLLVLYGVFLLAVLVLIFARPQPKARHEEPVGADDERLAIAQGR